MTGSRIGLPRRTWQILMGLGGLGFAIGGGNHPHGESGASGDQALIAMMNESSWYWSHVLILIGSILFCSGLFLAQRDAAAKERLGLSLRVAVFGSVVWLIEATAHLFAKVDLDALIAGDSAPIADFHMLIAPFGHLALFPALAVVAVLLARGWPWYFWPFAAVGVYGCIVFGLAAPLTVWVNEDLSWMFGAGAPAVALWLVSVGVLGLFSQPVESPSSTKLDVADARTSVSA